MVGQLGRHPARSEVPRGMAFAQRMAEVHDELAATRNPLVRMA